MNFKLLLLLVFWAPFILNAQLKFTNKKAGLGVVTDITHAGDSSGRIFVANQAGRVTILDSAFNTLGTLLNLDTMVAASGEKGLLGLAFHPNFKTNGHFFVNYNPNGTRHTRIVRFTAANPASNATVSNSTLKEILLITTAQFDNHKAGDLCFSPIDGYLYVTTGDGGSVGDPAGNGQNINTFLGKILRLNINTPDNDPYDVPVDNPFAATVGFKPEIWDFGVRNPWRISFDKSNGNLWIADVGQDKREEVNFEAAGAGGNNYGWNCREGLIGFSGCQTGVFVDPIYDYSHCGNPCNTPGFGNSITGGFVYRGTKPGNASMRGYYIFADFDSRHAWALKYVAGAPGLQATIDVKTISKMTPAGVTTFGELENGEILAGLVNGILGSIEPTTALPVSLVHFNGQWNGPSIELKWNTASEFHTHEYQIEKSADGNLFSAIGTVAAKGAAATYRFTDIKPFKTKNYYRLKTMDLDGQFDYSSMIVLQSGATIPLAYYRAALTEIQLPPNQETANYKVELFTAQGTLVKKGSSQNDRFSVADLPKGIYVLRMQSNQIPWVQKMLIY